MPEKYLTHVLKDFLTLVETMYKIHKHEGHSKKEISEKLNKKFKDVLKKIEENNGTTS